MSAEFDLIGAIDSAAAKLLDRAGFGVVADDKQDLPEQVKAFTAVVEWAKTRSILRPPEKVRSKFDGIKEQFSSAPKRRGRSPAAEAGSADAPGGDSAAEPAAGAPGLFDE